VEAVMLQLEVATRLFRPLQSDFYVLLQRAFSIFIQQKFKCLLNKNRPPADVSDFEGELIEQAQFKIWTQIRQGVFD